MVFCGYEGGSVAGKLPAFKGSRNPECQCRRRVGVPLGSSRAGEARAEGRRPPRGRSSSRLPAGRLRLRERLRSRSAYFTEVLLFCFSARWLRERERLRSWRADFRGVLLLCVSARRLRLRERSRLRLRPRPALRATLSGERPRQWRAARSLLASSRQALWRTIAKDASDKAPPHAQTCICPQVFGTHTDGPRSAYTKASKLET